MGLDINLNTSKVDISEDDGLNVDLYKDNIDISDDETDDIIIEITGLKSLNKFIGLEDTPLYYDNGKFFKVENNKVVYTDIEWKDISGDIQEAPEIVDLITELIEETSEHLVDRHINIHNNSEEAHPYIQNIIQENYNTLDEKIDNLETELSEDISNLNTALNAEITNREDADSVLGARIDGVSEDIQAEAITRLENDTILQNNINTLSDNLTAEISTRETADSNLSDSISDLSDDLIQEILDRQAGDNNLDSIKANISDVESITGALADSISALDSTVSANYETLDDKIDSINGALSDSINSLSSVVSSNYETLDDKIDSVNGALSDSITALDSVVSENYNTLDDKIDSINSALSDSISGLDTKYTSITGALSDSITALDNKYDTITDNLSDSITSLDNKYDSITSGLGDEIDSVEGALNTHISNTSNPHNVTKAQVGLGNVDNTSDLNKPISTATQSALDGKVPNTRTINNKALSSDITLTYTDVNALPDTTTINDLTTATQQNVLNSGINSTLTQQITTNQNNISNLSSTVSSNYTTLDNRITSEVNTLNSSISDEETARINADNGLQSQIDAITSASDVTDIVGTYAELQAYDTTSLPDKSIIKVLQDESRNDETTYYRWVITNGTGAWVLIGEEGPYYTKSEADGRFVTQTTTVNNKALSSNITLTASDVGALSDSTVIGNGTLTIQKNSTTIDTFDANATSNKTINISVPTDTSDLTNNAGFISGITSSDVTNALGYTPENINNKVTSLSSSSTDTQYPSAKLVYDELNDKQETLVSGTNIKTVNNNSLLGNGNITIDSLPSQSGQSGKFLTTNGTTASWSTISMPTVDQTYDGTSTNAQSGVAIEGELSTKYVKSNLDDYYIDNSNSEIIIGYMDDANNPTNASVINISENNGIIGGTIDLSDETNPLGFGFGVTTDGFGLINMISSQSAVLTVLNNNLAVNGTEVALKTDIPDISTKQDTLVSGTNIKTVNNTSLLGSGNLSVGTVKSVNNTQPDNNGNVSLTIPTVNDATLTIQKNGTTVSAFTANASSDVTCNITVPTAVTDLSDASNYVTNTGLSTILDDYATEQWTQQQASSLYTSIQGWVNNQGYVVSANLADVATTGDYDDLLNKPTIPQAQIQSDWDQTDSSAVDFIKNKPTIPSGVIVDQVYDGTSTNAQSGVAIEGELANYVQLSDIDSNLSTTSENPVQNRVVYDFLNYKQDFLNNANAGENIKIIQNGNSVWTTPSEITELSSSYNNWKALCYGNNKYVALGNAGYVSTSTDGVTWTTGTQNANLGNNNWVKIAYGASKFVALGLRGYISTSTNGTNWSTARQEFNQYKYWDCIGYGNNKFVVISRDSYVSTSTDGSNWSEPVYVDNLRDNSDDINWCGITYYNGQNGFFIAIGKKTLEQRCYLTTSSDGINWSRPMGIKNIYPSSYMSIAFGKYKYIEIGYDGSVTISKWDTCREWYPYCYYTELRSLNIGWNSLIFDGTDFIALNKNGYISKFISSTSKLTISAIIPAVDQTFDSSSVNAQSGVAIEGELATNYVKTESGNTSIANAGTEGYILYNDTVGGGFYGVIAGVDATYGTGVTLGAGNNIQQNGYVLNLSTSGLNMLNAGNSQSATLTISNSNLAVNGTEVALSTDIPTNISDLTDDTATNPVDKADTLTDLTATVTELNYTDGVTSNIQTQFNTITGKIPSQASTSNQLADKAFVNSSVQTATANFRGNWGTWTLVPTSASSYPADYAGGTTPTVNDYLVVQDASDYTGDTLEGTWRFKYTGTWSTDGKSGWNPEYQVNETPLTSAQLAALNSGITSSDVTLIGTALQPNDNISLLTNNARYIVNNTSTTNAISILGSTSTAGISIGPNSSAVVGSVSIGNSATTNYGNNVAIGASAQATGNNSTAIGYNAKATAQNAIQIGNGTNSTASTLQVGFGTNNTNWQLLNGTTGLIPDARISSNIARTSAIPDVSNFVTNSSLATTLSSYATQQWTTEQASALATDLQTWVTNQGYTTNIGTVTSVNNVQPDNNGNVAITIPTVPLEGVQINGTDLTISSKKVNIPVAGASTLGVGMANTAYGVYNYNNYLAVSKATDALVTAKANNFRPLVPSNIDLAVKTGITTNTLTLTDAEKATAKSWLGVTPTYDSTNERITW